MSPYRVVVVDKDKNKFIYVAMISTSKIDGSKKIYIVQKPYIADPSNETFVDILTEEKDVAYAMTTRRNSHIAATYVINKQDDRRYRLDYLRHKIHGVELTDVVDTGYRTLLECQMASIVHFCKKESLDIICVL